MYDAHADAKIRLILLKEGNDRWIAAAQKMRLWAKRRIIVWVSSKYVLQEYIAEWAFGDSTGSKPTIILID